MRFRSLDTYWGAFLFRHSISLYRKTTSPPTHNTAAYHKKYSALHSLTLVTSATRITTASIFQLPTTNCLPPAYRDRIPAYRITIYHYMIVKTPQTPSVRLIADFAGSCFKQNIQPRRTEMLYKDLVSITPHNHKIEIVKIWYLHGATQAYLPQQPYKSQIKTF